MLRPFTTEDAAPVQTLAGVAAVAATTLNLPHPYPDGAAAAWISTHPAAVAEGKAYTWAIVRAEDALLLGALTLAVERHHARGELGYWLGVPYWNRGYTTEAVRRVLVFGFHELRLHRIESTCFPRNRASSRVLEKAGLRYEGLLRGYVRKDAKFEDVALYAAIDEHW
ncbi:MAG: family N-acetyltransferase, partial [Chloroflexi bacterium]|nr:family N-acetyltransferase [Chloroflexota bacterium]